MPRDSSQFRAGHVSVQDCSHLRARHRPWPPQHTARPDLPESAESPVPADTVHVPEEWWPHAATLRAAEANAAPQAGLGRLQGSAEPCNATPAPGTLRRTVPCVSLGLCVNLPVFKLKKPYGVFNDPGTHPAPGTSSWVLDHRLQGVKNVSNKKKPPGQKSEVGARPPRPAPLLARALPAGGGGRPS